MSSNDTFETVDAYPSICPRYALLEFLNLAEDELAIGRDEPCTYRRALGIEASAPTRDFAINLEQNLPREDDVIKSTMSTDPFAFADVMPVQIPSETTWDMNWLSEASHSAKPPEVISADRDWDTYARREPAAINFTLSPSTWHGFFGDQSGYSQHQVSPSCTADTMDPSSLDFLAKFTSTTGFVNSFDCGTLEQRKLVVRSCTTTDNNKIYVHNLVGREDDLVNLCSTENSNKNSNTAVEAVSHIWGFILPEQMPVSDVGSHEQHHAPMKPLHTKNWMQGFSEELRTESIPTTTNSIPTTNFDFKTQDRHHLLSNPLTLMTHEILSRIKEVIFLKARNSIITQTWSPLLEAICLRFFCPSNLLKFIELYWACWHPNWPVVHKPTFSLTSAHPVLVAAMTIVGACMSPDAGDLENAKTWFDSVEEMAFSDEDLCDNSGGRSTSAVNFDASKSRRKVQALQAAYAVCLYQNWEGSDRNKCRIRRYRYSTVVAVARDLGLDSKAHRSSHLQDGNVFKWYQFAFEEEFIRTLIYIFLLDTAFVIFNNLPPRMVIKELKMDLACPESWFQAQTADECFASIESWKNSQTHIRTVSLCSAIETMLETHMDASTCEFLGGIGTLNLFTIASALHSLIFQCQASFSYEPRLAPLRNALANWKQVWLLHSSSESRGNDISADQEESPSSFDACNMWKRIGFMRNAPEFWLLAKVVLEKLEADRLEERTMPSLVDGLGKRGDILLLGTTVFEKYDETSMGQVNDIITMFQRLNV